METAEEYQEYEQAVEHGLAGLSAVSPGDNKECGECYPDANRCPHCNKLDVDESDCVETSFSGNSCDICRRNLGGNRYPAHGLDKDDKLVHLEICVDCTYYLAYGCLDDQTMLDIDSNGKVGA